VDHTASINFPLTIAKYFVFNPRFGYSENWFRIHQTDQSDAAGIDASTSYRAYRYDMGASFSTKLYGTIYPNIFGISGLRQVLSPTISYRYAPKVDRHPGISSYAGGSARSSSKSRSLSVGLNHTYQAKLRRGESERNLELASVSHSFNYDFERDSLRFSNLRTRVSSNLLRHIRLNATMTHSLYKSPGSSEVDFWNPHLMDFRANGTVTLRGSRFLFDDIQSGIPRGAPELDQVGLSKQSPFSSGGQGWDVSATYNYSETGKWSGIFNKTSSIRMSLHFNLTPTTKVTYSQYYDIVGKKTVNNQVSIVKIIHCWTGTFHWVPTGSTKGWGFRLFVTAMPAIKIDNSQNSLNSSYLQSIR
jgi:hypothetical protein